MTDPSVNEKKLDEIFAGCKKRMDMSYYKYGPARSNFAEGRVDAAKCIQLCLDKYEKTHNTEYLMDAMNYAAFRILYPWPDDFFKATDSGESAGVAGTPINMEKGNY